MKVCENPIGQQIGQSHLSMLSYPRISCVQWRKSQVFISFRSQAIEKALIRTDFVDGTLTVALQKWDYEVTPLVWEDSSKKVVCVI
jgi:hypothetical protein